MNLSRSPQVVTEQMRETLQVYLKSMPTALDLATLEYLTQATSCTELDDGK